MPSTLLCLATEKGVAVLRSLLVEGLSERLIVATFRDAAASERLDSEIARLAREANLPHFDWSEVRDRGPEFLLANEIIRVLLVGWRYLLPASWVTAVQGDVVIAHDSLLPKFRGFAPLATAMIAGETETGVTFLRPGPGIDDGPILRQVSVPIGPRVTIAELTAKLIPHYVEGARLFVQGRFEGGTPQDERLATYSIWRDELDYRLDWSQDATVLERSIRALGPPYLGARAQLGDQTVTIRQAELEEDVRFAIRQPGKIWNLDSLGRPLVVCGQGMLRIREAVRDGQSILPLRSLRQRFR